jgi:hypothetical protein
MRASALSRLAIFSLGLGMTVVTVPSSAQTLANGSFEQSGGSFTGWSAIGSTSIANITNTQPSLTPTNGSFQAFLSNNISGAVSASSLDSFFNINNIALPVDTLARGPTNGSAILQTFSIGTASTLSFDFKSVTSEIPGSQWDIMFYFVDGVITVLPNPDATGANPNNSFGLTGAPDSNSYTYGYNYQTISVALAAGTHTIGFGVYNTGDESVNSGLFIDNVVLGIPEPGTATLMGCGLFGLAATAWRRRRLGR